MKNLFQDLAQPTPESYNAMHYSGSESNPRADYIQDTIDDYFPEIECGFIPNRIAKIELYDKIVFSNKVHNEFVSGGILSDEHTIEEQAHYEQFVLAQLSSDHLPFSGSAESAREILSRLKPNLPDFIHEGHFMVLNPELHAALQRSGAFKDGEIQSLTEAARGCLPSLLDALKLPESALQNDNIAASLRDLFPASVPEKSSFRAKIEAERGQGQNASKIPLPTVAPERWKGRADKSETPHAFIERVYATWLPGGDGDPIGRGTIGKLDPGLYKQLREAETTEEGLAASQRLKIAPDAKRKVRGSTTEEEKAAFRAGQRPESVRDYGRISSAIAREEGRKL